jgi:hypothetical protein
MRRFWGRGNLFSYYGWEQLCLKFGESDIIREWEIPWKYRNLEGIGHADMYVKSRKEIWEVKSSVAPMNILETAIRQVKLYLYFAEEAESGVVYIINPSDLEREDLVPVMLTESDRAELAALLDSVAEAVDGGPLPTCSQGTPSACRQSGCQWSDTAWDGWQPPLPTSVEFDEEVSRLVERWQAMKDIEERARGAYAERKDIEAMLVELGVEPGDNNCGPYVIRRIQTKPRETFAWSAAKKSGVLHGLEELLQPFVRLGEASERFQIVDLG